MNPEMHTQIITLFITAVSAFILALLSGMWILPELKKLKLGQEVRDDGPESHLKKQGTPTMGGIMILLSMTAAVVIGFVRAGTAPVPALQSMVYGALVNFRRGLLCLSLFLHVSGSSMRLI